MPNQSVARNIRSQFKARYHRFFAIVLSIALAGCAATASVKQIDRLETIGESPRFLIMTPDVKYYLLPTGGVPQVQAEWTEAARINFSDSLSAYAAERNIDVVAVAELDQLSETEVTYQKLYAAIGSTVLNHHFGALKLPTKQGAFDWSLGPGVEVIGEKYDADYALFSYYRDYQATGGRVAFSIFAALAGIGVPAGSEVGFASLVDLRTGDIVWFNRVASGVGELREADQARAAVDELFKNLPTE